MKRLLFICWDGPQVNYLEGLFLPIFIGLRDEYEIHIIQFSWASDKKISYLEAACEAEGIIYNHCKIQRKPLPLIGSVITLFRGIDYIKKYIKKEGIDLVMPRSTFPALMILSALGSNHRTKLIFDADGLPLDERADFASLNRSSLQYKYLKSIEYKAIKSADVVITRTSKAIDILTKGEATLRQKFQVVTNGRDTSFFKTQLSSNIRQDLGVKDNAILLISAGSLGPQYCVLETLKLYRYVRQLRMDSYLLILTGSPEYLHHDQFKSYLDANVIVKSVTFNEMPFYLASADVGLAIRQPSFSMKGVAPIKIGEYLLSGLPVVASTGIGDTEELLSDKSCCFVLPSHEDAKLKRAAEWVVSLIGDIAVKHDARKLGEEKFSLKRSIELYKLSLKRLN